MVELGYLCVNRLDVRPSLQSKEGVAESFDSRMRREVCTKRGWIVITIEKPLNWDDLRLRLIRQLRFQLVTLLVIHTG